MGISRSQAQAIADGFLESVSAGPRERDAMPIVGATLALMAEAFINKANSNLDAAVEVNSGELSRQLTFYVEQSGSVYELSVGYPASSAAAVYWDFVNKGVQGVNKAGKGAGSPYKFRFIGASKNHVDAIEAWLRTNGKGASNVRKPMNALETKRKTIRNTISANNNLRSLAYATAVSSKINGLRATRFFDDAVESNFGKAALEAIAVSLAGEVRLSVRQLSGELKRLN